MAATGTSAKSGAEREVPRVRLRVRPARKSSLQSVVYGVVSTQFKNE